MKSIEHFSPVLQFTILYKVVQSFESVDEIHKGATSQMKATE